MTELRTVEMTPYSVCVGAWMFARDGGVSSKGDGTVMFAGASRVNGAHPMRFGDKHYPDDDQELYFVNGELTFRPVLVAGTNEFKGYTIGQLMIDGALYMEEQIADGRATVVYERNTE